MTLFATWLAQTRQLQTDTYGMNYAALDDDISALAAYVDWNLKSAILELAEAYNEISWKPWAQDKPFVNRESLVKELVDVLHFTGNVICALGVSDEELNQVYLAKMDVNRARQLRGYFIAADGEKCTGCSRALDDVEPSTMYPGLCVVCEENVTA